MGETLAMILLTAGAVVAFMASEAVREIERRSGGEYPIKETTLYSAFGRLEKQGYIVPYQGSETQGRPRTYYTITDEGRRAYAAKCAEWRVLKTVVDRFAKEDTEDGSDS